MPNAIAVPPHAKPLCHAASGSLKTVLPDIAEFKAKSSVTEFLIVGSSIISFCYSNSACK
jgi:hypothetical protein